MSLDRLLKLVMIWVKSVIALSWKYLYMNTVHYSIFIINSAAFKQGAKGTCVQGAG